MIAIVADEIETVPVPKEVLPDLDVIVAILREEAAKNEGMEKGEIVVLRPKTMRLGPGEVVQPLVYFGGLAMLWLSEKWVEEFLWPELKKRVKTPGQASAKWVLDQVLPAVKRGRKKK